MAALLKFSPIMLKIMLTLLHCAQHYAHLQCKKSFYQTVAYIGTDRDPPIMPFI